MFKNRDGTLTVQAYLTPIHYRTAEGWQPIDNAISSGPGRDTLSTRGNDWTVSFGPAAAGVRLRAPEGELRMRPVRPADGGTAPEVVSSPERREPESAKEALAEPAIPEPGVVRYERVWPEVDLRYEVHGHGLEEHIVVLSPRARSGFLFEIDGATLTPDADGGLRLGGPMGRRWRIPAPTVLGADGSDLTAPSGVRFALMPSDEGADRSAVAVVLDEDWLRRQPGEIFPLVVDPDVSISDEPATNAITIDSSGNKTRTAPNISLGSQGGVVRRAAVHFSQYESWLNEGLLVYNAALALVDKTFTSVPTTVDFYDQGAGEPSTFGSIGSGTPLIGSWGPNAWPFNPFVHTTDTLNEWLTQNLADRWFGLRGTESGDTLKSYDAVLTANLYFPPDPSRVTNLAADQVLSTTTPTLRTQAIPPPADDSARPMYDYQITTAPAPGTGMVVSSGRMSADLATGELPTWTVPEGTLQEGLTYYAWVLTDWSQNNVYSEAGAPQTVPPPSWGVPFTVKLGLGEGGPSPTDEVGAVPGQASTPSEGAPNPSLPPSKVTVNLVNGNASISVDTASMTTVSGPLGLRFTYNSLAATDLDVQGLRAAFYNDSDNDGVIDPGTDPLVGERVDPTVAFDLASLDRLVAGQDPSRALAEWTGFLTLPNDHTWKLGAISSDGIRITSDSTVLLDDYASHAPQATPTFGESFGATPARPIKVEWHHSSSNRAVAQVFAQDQDVVDDQGNHPIYALSPDWLSRSPKVLPAGWIVNTAASSSRWVSLADRGSSVTVFSEDGTGFEFRAVGDGSYTPPVEAPNDLLQVADDGTFILESANLIYTFGPTGALLALATAADDREPAAVEYGYGGAPPLLRTITDPVRCASADPCPDDATVALSYGGDAGAPSGCSGAPAAMLCDIAYWDATSTTLTYDGSGRLVRITNPGDIVYDFAYDASDRLTEVRDPLANAAIGAGVRPDDATARTQIAYTDGRVSSITQPAPMPGEPRPERIYCYGFAEADAATKTCTDPAAKTTSVGVVGFTPAVGFAHRVAYDDRNRIVSSTDSAGLTTTYVWDENDRHVATVDPAGVETSTAFDALGYPVASYGPAPASAFDDDGRPKPGADVPTTTTDYDGGLSGLAAAWHPNTDLGGNAAYHTTSDLDEDWSGACDSPSSCDGAGSLVPGSGFGGRLTGRLTLPEPGRVDLNAGGGRVFVDDHLVVDQQGGPYSGSVRADRPMHWWRLSEPTGAPVALDGAGDRPATYASTGVGLGQPGPIAGDDSTAAALDGAAGTARAPTGPTCGSTPASPSAWRPG